MFSFPDRTRSGGAIALVRLTLAAAAAALILALITAPGPAEAQTRYQPLSVKEKNFLLRMAREPVAAILEGRRPRDLRAPSSMRRLNQSQRLVMTIFLDGELLARAWELRTPGVLQATTVSLAHRIMQTPDVGRPPTYEEMPRIRIGLAVLHDLKEVATEKEALVGQALVALSGFSFAVGLPSDLPRGYTTFQLYSRACEISGLRSGEWLGDDATIYAGAVEEFFEN